MTDAYARKAFETVLRSAGLRLKGRNALEGAEGYACDEPASVAALTALGARLEQQAAERKVVEAATAAAFALANPPRQLGAMRPPSGPSRGPIGPMMPPSAAEAAAEAAPEVVELVEAPVDESSSDEDDG